MQTESPVLVQQQGLTDPAGLPSLKILHVIRTLNPSWGGPMEGLRHITGQAIARHHRPEIVTLDDSSSAWIPNFAAKVHPLGARKSVYGYASEMDKWLDTNIENFDRVIVHGVWHYHSYAVWKAARRRNIPYYLFTHGYLDPWFEKNYPLKHIKKLVYWKLFEHKVLRDAKAVLFTSEEEMRLAHGSFEPYRCQPRVVGYGVPPTPPAELAKDDLIQHLTSIHPELRGRQFLLFLARIHEKKGIDMLLAAFASAKEKLPHLALVVAGQGSAEMVKGLKAQAERLGIQDDVIWTGPVYGAMKWSIMSAAEAYILPSHQENFGISVAEALSRGTPVLISDKVNIWREIEEAKGGIVAPDDIEGTTAMLNRWANLSADEKSQMQVNAKQCYDKCFDISKTANRFFQILLES